MKAIYVILNCVNGKVYLGSTNNFKQRTGIHISLLRSGKHSSRHLQYAWNKYGANSFVIFPIEEFEKISGDALLKKRS